MAIASAQNINMSQPSAAHKKGVSMATRYTVSPIEDGRFGVFCDGEFLNSPGSGTWGAAKKEANRFNDALKSVKMRYKPMLAKDSKTFLHGPEYIVERKWDGMRAIFEIDEDETRIFSRTGQDLGPQFPELCRLHEVLVPSVLDGEIVALVANANSAMVAQLSSKDGGEENLELLQWRISDKKAMQIHTVPVTVKFFDVLEAQGHCVVNYTFQQRRELLEEVVGPDFMVETMEGADIPPHWEGVVSKLRSSRYECGKRRVSWSKYKFVNRATLWAVGLTSGKGARSSSFGAVMVCDANSVPRGQVGSGFTQNDIDEIQDLMPYGPFLIEVEYRFLSKTGLMVNTAYKGLRIDKQEADTL